MVKVLVNYFTFLGMITTFTCSKGNGLNSIEITVPLIEFSVCSAAIELNVDLKIASRPTQDYVRGKTRVYVALSINVIKHQDNFFF